MSLNKNKNFCYRITHIQNLSHILNNGLCIKDHPNADPNFIPIGNPSIISYRDSCPVKIEGYGTIGDYVPFYFTSRSMMLFNIITGIRAPLVPKRSKEEIIVFRCLINNLSNAGRFFFTDGQANVTSTTNHYNDLTYLNSIDWEIIQNSDFKKEPSDNDKQRRYQAEFLVYQHVPFSFVESLNVYNITAAKFVQKQLAKTDILLPVHINSGYFFD